MTRVSDFRLVQHMYTAANQVRDNDLQRDTLTVLDHPKSSPKPHRAIGHFVTAIVKRAAVAKSSLVRAAGRLL